MNRHNRNTDGDGAWDGRRLTEARLAAAWRRCADFPQSELARVVGVTPPTIGRYEKGVKTPSAEMIAKLADAVGCDRGWLMYGPSRDGTYIGKLTTLMVRGSYAGDGDGNGDGAARKPRGKRVTVRRKFELPSMWMGDDAERFYAAPPVRRRA